MGTLIVLVLVVVGILVIVFFARGGFDRLNEGADPEAEQAMLEQLRRNEAARDREYIEAGRKAMETHHRNQEPVQSAPSGGAALRSVPQGAVKQSGVYWRMYGSSAGPKFEFLRFFADGTVVGTSDDTGGRKTPAQQQARSAFAKMVADKSWSGTHSIDGGFISINMKHRYGSQNYRVACSGDRLKAQGGQEEWSLLEVASAE